MPDGASYAEWIGIDWGMTHLRAWAMAPDGSCRDEARSDSGAGTLTPDRFEAALLALIEPWLGAGRMPVVICGAAGAAEGWAQAPYARVPCRPQSADARPVTTADGRLRVDILGGLCQDSPAAVLRGEETQIAGFLFARPDFDGILCLPGTHSMWAQISAGEVVSFRSFMTGDLFAAISQHTVLRNSLGDPATPTAPAAPEDDDGFALAVTDMLSRPERLASDLLSLRAETLLHGMQPGQVRARLSGLLIGAELAAARPYWLGQQVVLIGTPDLAGRYAEALATQSVPSETADPGTATRAGLALAYARLSLPD